MTGYLITRTLSIIPMLIVVTLVVFLVINVLPGDPAVLIAGDQASEETVNRVRQDLGLDRPVLVRYVDWLADLVRGDFGHSLKTRADVRGIVADALPVTIELAFMATVIMLAAGVTLGVGAAAYRNSPLDIVATTVGTLGIAVPNFWLGLLLVDTFSLRLDWLPSAGFIPVWENPGSGFRYAILPSLTLAAPGIAVLTRQTRSSILDAMAHDYVRTARAKGLHSHTVLLRHALRNALLPVITVVGLQVALLIGGSVIVEVVFAVPGMGRLIVDSIFFRDYPVVQAAAVVMVTMILVLNVAVDIAYVVADPRIQLAGSR
jgi:peptide/nickel transport system permease protein